MIDTEKKTGKRQIEHLCKYLTKLEPLEFTGICRMMNVGLIEEDGKTLRDAENLIQDIIDKYCEYNRIRRRNLMALLESIVKGRK